MRFSKKNLFFTVGGRHGTDRKTDRQARVSYHIEVRTLYARHIFREYHVPGGIFAHHAAYHLPRCVAQFGVVGTIRQKQY